MSESLGMFIINHETLEQAERLAALCADGTTAADVIAAALVEYGERMDGAEEEGDIERNRATDRRTPSPR